MKKKFVNRKDYTQRHLLKPKIIWNCKVLLCAIVTTFTQLNSLFVITIVKRKKETKNINHIKFLKNY